MSLCIRAKNKGNACNTGRYLRDNFHEQCRNVSRILIGFALILLVAMESRAALSGPVTNTTGTFTLSGVKERLQEKFNGGSWQNIGSYSSSDQQVTLSGKSSGRYEYKYAYSNPNYSYSDWWNCYHGPGLRCGPTTRQYLDSNIISVTVVRAPGKPANIALSSTSPVNSKRNYRVAWGSASGALTQYQLQESLNGGSYNTIHTSTNLSLNLSGRSRNTHYRYRVRAYYTQSGITAYSGWRYSSTWTVPTTPGTPGTITTTEPGESGDYRLSWSAASGSVTRYEVQERPDGASWSRIYNAKALSLNIGSRNANTYDYRARACDVDGCGSYTAVSRVTVPEVPVETVTYVYTDILGSPILETDEQGKVTAEYHYLPFGNTKETKSEDVGYTGHLEDTDLQLTYMQARYYDPVLGRFYSNDPVGFQGHLNRGNPIHGFNRYAYANNNPYKYKDPDGEFIMLAFAVVSIGITAYDTYQTYQSEGATAAAKTLAIDGAISLAGGGVLKVATKAAKVISKTSRGAESAANGVKLEKQLASESQLSELAEGGGTVISQPAKQADRIAAQTGAKPENIQKVSSDAHIAKDGQQVQTHTFRDASTNELIEPKTIINEHN